MRLGYRVCKCDICLCFNEDQNVLYLLSSSDRPIYNTLVRVIKYVGHLAVIYLGGILLIIMHV